MYADLLRFYGVDLQGLFYDPPEVDPKRAMALVEGLPQDSRTMARLRGASDSAGWDTNSYLLASLIDVVRENTFVNMQVRTKKKLKPFEQVPIPGVKKQKKKGPKNSFALMAQQQLSRTKE